MMEALRRANVALYAVDPRGRVESGDLLREWFPDPVSPSDRQLRDDPCSAGTEWNSVVRQAQRGLQIVSDAAGGFGITNTDDQEAGVRQILDDLDTSTYSDSARRTRGRATARSGSRSTCPAHGCASAAGTS